jgi:nitrogenase molybdenum-iron protein alpha/beta subunit
MQASMQASVQSKNTVNIIGCNMAPAASGELYSVLADLGYLALHIGQFVNFDDFQSMSASSLNLLTTTAGQLAANEMQENFGISQLLLPVNWDLETIKDDYQTLAAALAVDSLPEATVELLDCLQQQAQDSLNATRLDLDNRPIAIDDTATTRPYSLAAMLYKNGFNVIAIATDGCPDIEQESLEWLQANTDVQTLDYNSHNAPRSRTARPEVLAIGMECAYLLQTSLIVDMTNDEQHYGYHGLLWLLEQMRAAVELEVDLEQSLTAHGLVI